LLAAIGAIVQNISSKDLPIGWSIHFDISSIVFISLYAAITWLFCAVINDQLAAVSKGSSVIVSQYGLDVQSIRNLPCPFVILFISTSNASKAKSHPHPVCAQDTSAGMRLNTLNSRIIICAVSDKALYVAQGIFP